MKNINIIVMGKTGAGKSTLINAVLEEDLAPTGKGQAVTLKNTIYSKKMLIPIRGSTNEQYRMVGCKVNMYDTVGLEIDNAITYRTLEEIKGYIEATKSKIEIDDLFLVWFCVNNGSSRFETYELELIRRLSKDKEIPFVMVLTQCFSDEEGELEEKIRKNLSEMPRKRVLAKEYPIRGGSRIPAYGIPGLLQTSVNDYKNLKAVILENKLSALEEMREGRVGNIQNIQKRGNEIIADYTSKATKIGFIPGGCIPFVHGLCIKMIADLNNLAGLKSSKNFANDIFVDVILGIIVTPFMVVPLLSVATAASYMQTVGDDYLKALLEVIRLSSDRELKDNELMRQRIKEELNRLKK